jgi:hypothetical protein
MIAALEFDPPISEKLPSLRRYKLANQGLIYLTRRDSRTEQKEIPPTNTPNRAEKPQKSERTPNARAALADH